MTISIKIPEKDGVKTAIGTRVFTSSGAEIEGVTSISLNIKCGQVISATLEIHVDSVDGMDNIHAALGSDTLEKVAALHGYELVKVK